MVNYAVNPAEVADDSIRINMGLFHFVVDLKERKVTVRAHDRIIKAGDLKVPAGTKIERVFKPLNDEVRINLTGGLVAYFSVYRYKSIPMHNGTFEVKDGEDTLDMYHTGDWLYS